MRFYTLPKLLSLTCITALVLICICLSACNNDEKTGFGLHLADSDELIFSEEHIVAYDWDSHTIELNNKGLEKWNSYIDDVDIPRLDTKFYKEGFVVKIKGEEIYRGQFTSIVSSAFPQ